MTELHAEPDAEFIRFTNGLTLRIGQEVGGMRDDVWRVQIRHTVKKHLDKELQLHNRGIKVLSLFFIDRVASYRDYDAAGISRCAHLLAPVPRRAFPMAAAPCAHTSRVCTPTSQVREAMDAVRDAEKQQPPRQSFHELWKQTFGRPRQRPAQ
jgi:restriction endonuclease